MPTNTHEHDDIVDLGAASEVTLGFMGQPVEALTLPDHQDKP